MRKLTTFQMISLFTAIVVSTIAVAHLHAGCFREENRTCSQWYNGTNPYEYAKIAMGINGCTQALCPCTGNPQVPAGDDNPSACGCDGVVNIFSENVIGAFPCEPNQAHNGCKDNWTIRMKANGDLDDVECGTITGCDLDCHAETNEVNGNVYFLGNVCGQAASQKIIANQAKVVGNPC